MLKKTLFAALVAIMGVSCADVDNGGPQTGNTQILLTDAPFPYEDIAKVEVHINSVDASADADTSNGLGNWETIAAPDRVFDLLQLQRGETAVLGDADLPAGTYRAIRLTIDPSKSSITKANGSQATVQWPQTPSGLIIMHALVEEPLATGAGARIVIDFDVGRSFLVLEGMPVDFVFSPWLRAVNEAATGDLEGEVFWTNSIEGSNFGGNSGPLANASVTVYRGNPAHEGTWWVAATGTTDANGRYRIAFLRQAEYIVRFEGTTPEGYGCSQFTAIQVNVQQSTELNAAVFPHDGCVAPDPDPNDTLGTDTSIVTPGGPVHGINIRTWLGGGVSVGDSIGVYAELTNAQGAFLSGRTVTWTVSDPTVFNLQQFGGQHAVLRALKQGSATVTATSEGKTNQIQINVGAAPTGPVTDITLSPHASSGRVNDTIGVNAALRNAQFQVLPGGVTWQVSDPTVLQLIHQTPNYAVVRGLKAGTAMLRAWSDTVTRAVTLNIYTDSGGVVGGAVASVTLNAFPTTPHVGDSLGVFAALANAQGQPLYGRAVTWTVSDPTVWSITWNNSSQSLLGRAMKAGTVTITATSEGVVGSKTVTIQ